MVHMVQGTPGRRTLADSQHVARYCRPRDIGSDSTPIPTAFRLRPGEEYLSTNWLEHFHDSERSTQIDGVRRSLSGKGFRFSRSAAFAVLNVGSATTQCGDALNVDIQFVVLGESHDPSHTGIYGYVAQNAAVAELLAGLVSPRAVYPAAASPAQET